MSDWQQAASGVLVAMGRRFVGKVMEELLPKFQPGILPHCSVVQTLANLSISNGRWEAAAVLGHPLQGRRMVRQGLCHVLPLAVFGMVPFLPSILNALLPMLSLAKHDSMRVVFCCGKTVGTSSFFGLCEGTGAGRPLSLTSPHGPPYPQTAISAIFLTRNCSLCQAA